MNAALLTYWHSQQLPLIDDVRHLLAAQLAQMAAANCWCTGAQKCIHNMNNTRKINTCLSIHLVRTLNSRSWCIACQRQILYIPARPPRNHTIIFVYSTVKNKWKVLKRQCICKYLPPILLEGHATCRAGRIHDCCEMCDR